MVVRFLSKPSIALTFLLSGSLHAEPVYVFDGLSEPYVTDRSVIRPEPLEFQDVGLGEAGANDVVSVLPFNPTVPLDFPEVSTTMEPIYGGFRAVQDGGEKFHQLIALAEADDDGRTMLRFQSGGSAGRMRVFNGMAIWKVDDMGADLGQLSFFTESGWGPRFKSGEFEAAIHIVVQIDGIYYLSSEHTLEARKPFAFEAADSGWQPWDFGANGGNNFKAVFDDMRLGSELTGRIEAMGVYMRGISLISNNLSRNIDRFGYEVIR